MANPATKLCYQRAGSRRVARVAWRAGRPGRAAASRSRRAGWTHAARCRLHPTPTEARPHLEISYFCCLTFFYMKAHSLIHASGIVDFFSIFLHSPYIDILATSYFFRDYKTESGSCAFFAVFARGGGGCSQLENYSLPTPVEPTFRYFCLL